MDKKLNKFRLKRLVLLVFALVGFVLQAEATSSKFQVNVSSNGNGTAYCEPSSGEKDGTNVAVSVKLTANANNGYSFVKWTGDLGENTTNPWNTTVYTAGNNGGTRTYNVTANFTANNYYAKMTANASGASGGGTVLVAGGSSGTTSTYTNNTPASPGGSTSFTLTASANSGYYFVGWYKDSGFTQLDNGNSSYTCTVSTSSTANGTASYTRYAKFAKIPKVGDTYYLDLALGYIVINSTTFSGTVYDKTTNNFYSYNQTYTSDDKFYVYQSTLDSSNPNFYTNYGWNGTDFDIPNYDPIVIDGKSWEDYSLGKDDVKAMKHAWEDYASNSLHRTPTNHRIIIKMGNDNTRHCDITIDNIWSSFSRRNEFGQGSDITDRLDGGILCEEGGNITLKVLNYCKLMGICVPAEITSGSSFTFQKANASKPGSLTIVQVFGEGEDFYLDYIDPNLGGNSTSLIGGWYFSGPCRGTAGLVFKDIDVYAGFSRFYNSCGHVCPGVISGGANSDGEITINGGRITAVSATTAAAIGGGGGVGGTGNLGKVTITGGTIYAYNHGEYFIGVPSGDAYKYFTGAVPGTAIGGGSTIGYCRSSAISNGIAGPGEVTITGGEVHATSVGGVAIGGGNNVACYGGNCKINISGNAKVFAESTSGTIGYDTDTVNVQYASAMGGGSVGDDSGFESHVDVSAFGGDAELTISGSAIVQTGSVGGGDTKNTHEDSHIGYAKVYISESPVVNGQFIMAKGSGDLCSFTMEGGTVGNATYSKTKSDGGAVWMDDPNGKVTITGGTISGCSADNGGAVWMSAGTFECSGSGTIRNNTATGNGGALYITNGTVTISGGTIGDENAVYGNKAAVGGGIYAGGGTITVESAGKVLGNTATSNGGGIYAGGGSVEVKDGAKLVGNKAANGAGLYANGGSVSVSNNAQLSSNIASTNGGGVYAKSALTINGSTLQNNQAQNGNGGAFYVEVTEGAVGVSSATITNNGAVNGAGAYVAGNLNLSSSTIEKNEASGNGGGLYVNGGNLTLTGGNIGAKDNPNHAVNGGGIYMNGGAATVSNGCAVNYNTATNGAGLYANGGSVSVSNNAQLSSNIASTNGGGVYAKSALTINGSTLQNNQARNGNGGAFYVEVTEGAVGVSNATITNNGAVNGAGAYVAGNLNLSSSTIEDNAASGNGGGVYSAGGITTLTSGMKVNGNGASNGGGFYVGTDGTIEMDGGEINSNTASQCGGALYTSGTFTLNSGNIEGNTASGVNDNDNDNYGGGGIYAAAGSISIHDGFISGNEAPNGSGGGIYSLADLSMDGGLIGNNTSKQGGGIYAKAPAEVTLTDGSISENFAIDGGGIYIGQGATVNLYKNAAVTDNTCGDNTLDNGFGGGIYQGGTLNVAGDFIMVTRNTKATAVKDATGTPNNIFLLNENVDDYTTCINVVNWTDTVTGTYYIGLTGSVDIGISVNSVPQPVLHSETPEYEGHLVTLYDLLNQHSTGTLVKDDKNKYQAIYSDGPLPYNLNDIFFTGTWQAFAYPEGVTEFKDDVMEPIADTYFGNIGTNQRLAEFMCYVNGLNGYSPHPEQDGQVTNDLYMNEYVWLPIGCEDGNNSYPLGVPEPYRGHFDGGGHIITGLTSVGLLGLTTYGLFGRTEDATISNTFVTECQYRANASGLDSYDTIGGIVGKMVGGKLYYSEAGGRLYSSGQHSIMGGLVGYAEDAEIHSCMAMPAMECSNEGTMGGLVGKMYAKDLNLNHGFCRVMNCFANPMFTTTSTTAIGGGLVGVMNTNSSYNRCEVTESYVRLDRKHSFPTAFATDKGIAALVGDMSKTNNTTSMNNVYLPEEGHCGVPGYSYVLPHRITLKGSISNYATYRAVSDPGVYAYDPAQDTRIDVIQQGVIPCPDEPQLLPQLLKQAVDRNYAQAEEDRPVPPICYWKRTGANSFLASGENINGDYPILDFDSVSPICGKDYAPAYIALGSKDGLTMDYCVSLSDMLRRYNNYEGGGAINLFHSVDNTGGVNKVTNSDVRLYLDEGVTILQGEGSLLNAVSYQTLREGSVDYWHTFSTVMGPRETLNGTRGESRIGFRYGITGAVAYDFDASNPCNVSLDQGTDPTEPNSNNSLFPYSTPIDSLDLYAFYEPEYHWINFKRNSDSHWHMDGPWEKIEYDNEEYLMPGKGYLLALYPEKKIYEYGILNCGNVSTSSRSEDQVTLTVQSSGRGYPGYNLLGNPYQAYLDLDRFTEANEGLWSGESGLDESYYIYDVEQNAYLGYKYGTEVSEGSAMPSKWLAPHQGFFIVKSNAGGPTTARFIETGEGGMCDLNGDGGLLRGGKPAYRLFNLTLTDAAGHGDVVSVEFGRPSFGGMAKQKALRSGDAIISASYGDQDYALLFLDEDVKSLPLHFDCTEGGTYTLSWNTANGRFPRLTLVDNLTGVSTDCLTSDSYTFEARPDDYKSRFKLVFHYDFDEEEESESHISNFAFVNGGDLIVNGQGYMEVMDVSGHVLLRTRLTDGQSRVSIPEVAAGIYIIRLGEKSQKIVIR